MGALRFCCLVVAIVFCLVDPARGGGLEFPDNGTRAVGRGGAFTARADDLTAVYYNPAGLIKSQGYFNILYNHNLTWNHVEYERKAWDFLTNDWHEFEPGENPVQNQKPLFPLGALFFVSSDFGTDMFVMALGAFGPSAIGAMDFPEDGSQKYMMINREILMLYYCLSAAFKITDDLSLGLTLQYVDMPSSQTTMMVDGYYDSTVYPFDSRYDVITHIEVADRFNLTGILGVWYRPAPWLELGLAGTPVPVWINATGTVSLDPVGSFVAGSPTTLYRGATVDDGVSLKLILPPKVRLGTRFVYGPEGREIFDIELDVFVEFWNMLERFDIELDGNRMEIEISGAVKEVDMGPMSLEKQYNPTVSVRLGGDWNIIPGWFALRAGGFYESPAVDRAYTYLDFLSFHRFGVGGGATVSFYGVDISLAYSHIFELDREVGEVEGAIYQQRPGSMCTEPYTDARYCDTNYLGVPGPVVNSGIYRSSYDVLSLGLAVNFETMFR